MSGSAVLHYTVFTAKSGTAGVILPVNPNKYTIMTFYKRSTSQKTQHNTYSHHISSSHYYYLVLKAIPQETITLQ